MSNSDISRTDPKTLLVDIHTAGRQLVPILQQELPGLFRGDLSDHRETLVDLAVNRKLREPVARLVMADILAECDRLILEGTSITFEGYDYGDGHCGCDEIKILTDEAKQVLTLRTPLADLAEMVERVDDIFKAEMEILAWTAALPHPAETVSSVQ